MLALDRWEDRLTEKLTLRLIVVTILHILVHPVILVGGGLVPIQRSIKVWHKHKWVILIRLWLWSFVRTKFQLLLNWKILHEFKHDVFQDHPYHHQYASHSPLSLSPTAQKKLTNIHHIDSKIFNSQQNSFGLGSSEGRPRSSCGRLPGIK